MKKSCLLHTKYTYRVIPPFLTGFLSRLHAACFNFCIGVIPPMAMMGNFYTAILERDADGFSVYFPDVPGCTSAGATMQDAAVNAHEALHAHLMLGLEHGETIPVSRTLDDIPVDPHAPEAARVLVRFDAPERAVRVNITLPENLLRQVDSYAQTHGFTRSGLLAQAVREYVERA